MPDLEDAAIDVSHSRIIDETSEFAAGDKISPEVTAAVPAGGAVDVGGSVGDGDDRAGETVQVSGTPPARATTTGDLSPSVVNGSRGVGKDRADFGRLLWLGLGALALLGLLALVVSQCGGDDNNVIGSGSDGTETDGGGADDPDSDDPDSDDSDAGDAAGADEGDEGATRRCAALPCRR